MKGKKRERVSCLSSFYMYTRWYVYQQTLFFQNLTSWPPPPLEKISGSAPVQLYHFQLYERQNVLSWYPSINGALRFFGIFTSESSSRTKNKRWLISRQCLGPPGIPPPIRFSSSGSRNRSRIFYFYLFIFTILILDAAFSLRKDGHVHIYLHLITFRLAAGLYLSGHKKLGWRSS